MPQAPSPNMSIVWPTDHNDNDAWDVIMDTAIRTTVDRHDHTNGKGVRIPSAALRIDADISWASGGSPFSITDIRAVDFFQSPPSGVVGFAGALFVADGSAGTSAGELYWRTVLGSNVKLTNGASLNVAGFIGGIGGDYSAVGALESFDDASHSYLFQQQLDGGTRQWSPLRTGGVDLYEFKVHGTIGVPALRVRLQSPTGLVGNYALTFPGALPASTSFLQSDNAGNISYFIQPTKTVSVDGSAFQPITGSTTITHANGCTFSGGTGIQAPLSLPAGVQITAARFFVQDNATGPTLVQGTLEGRSATGAVTGNVSSGSAGTGANQTLTIGMTTNVVTGRGYFLQIIFTTFSSSSILYFVEIDYVSP